MSSFDLVIFDCDGVLVDSEALSNTVLVAMLNEQGLTLTLQDAYRDYVGRSMSDCFALAEQRLGRALPQTFEQDFRERTAQAFQHSLQPVAGIEEALDAIDLQNCVASSGPMTKIRLTLGITKLLPRFDGRLFSAAEVARSKPFPDVFLYAAEKMNTQPHRCVVVEDSAVGVRAATAAGMSVLGYAEHSNAESLRAQGALVFDAMQDLPSLIANFPTSTSTL